MSICIFTAEKEAGLEELITSSAAVALCADTAVADPFDLSTHTKAYLSTQAENKNQVDLIYLKTILVSTGWNRNDDVFDPLEMWSAKSSPEDKPFNYEHHQDDIIGHITGCCSVDKSGNIVDGDIPPSEYDIIASSVLYRIWEDPVKQARMDKIHEEITQGKWFVSMEALFQGFDYALSSEKGIELVNRNEQTAFLTKHLRAYGGSGKFEDAKIGRVLRNIVFSGKGLVRKPANPDSVILSTSASSGYDEEKSIMNDEIKSIVKAEDINMENANEVAVAEIKAELLKTQEELAQVKSEQRLSLRLSIIAEKLDADKEHSSALASALNGLSEEDFNTVVATAESYMAQKIAAYKSNHSEMDAIKASVDELLKCYHFNALKQKEDDYKKDPEEETEAKPIAKKIAQQPQKMICPMPNMVKSSDDSAEEVNPSDALENAEPNEEPALATQAESRQTEKVAAQIAAYFGVSGENVEEV